MTPAPADPDTAAPGQFALLRQRRFAPYFWTQFLGAGNDNLFKFAFTVLVTYQLQVAWLPPALAGVVIGGVFILPFVLCSATSGQLSDRMEKGRLMRLVKNLELAIMAAAALGWWLASPALLLACVAGMGLHSTLFGPVKFAYLPQHLSERELTGGNGLVEMGTFVAILLGNLAGGVLIALPGAGPAAVAGACLAVAALGRWAAQGVPLSPPTDPGLRVNWNPFTETARNLRLARGDAVVFQALLGISWMWFYGAVYLANFPVFAKDVLHGDEHVASLLLVLFSVGVGAGALACERLSRRHVEVGLVPLGALGMSLFGIDLFCATRALPPGAALLPLGEFLARPAHWRVMADLLLLAAATGLYSVPLYALIQWRSPPSHRARIIAANNILNALFMVASSLGAGALLGAGWDVPQVLLGTALLNAVVVGAVAWQLPDIPLRAAALLLARGRHRLQVDGAAALPAEGAALLAHAPAGAGDALLLLAAGPRPLVWLQAEGPAAGGPGGFGGPRGRWLRRRGRAIALPPPQDAPARADALARAARVLADGGLLAVADAEALAALRRRHPAVPVLAATLSGPAGRRRLQLAPPR